MNLDNINFNAKDLTISKAFENALWLGIFAQTLDQMNRAINLSKQFANMLTIEEVKEIKAKVEKQSKESGK
jgi:hypothetical protein|tara:strand:+ start:477 stop:689 length:213 start_codon:yes stop_codon:yes gene_type:complete